MKRFFVKSVLLTASAMAALLSTSALAGVCYPGNTQTLVAVKGKTNTVSTQRAGNTWEDWIWRGYDKEVRCPRWGTISCSQTVSVAKTTGYKWDVGATFNPGSIPVVGGALGFVGLTGGYGRYYEHTTRYDRQIVVQPGWGMYPIQVVVRRWVG
ncbi:hypothetical protein, partial [Hydrogenophaga sp. A37]|uniref:hypothetical protein n=1 Tax=Hydrogenophaga sp. A37 TaxID=1945864 RepID=UPI001C0E5957